MVNVDHPTHLMPVLFANSAMHGKSPTPVASEMPATLAGTWQGL